MPPKKNKKTTQEKAQNDLKLEQHFKALTQQFIELLSPSHKATELEAFFESYPQFKKKLLTDTKLECGNLIVKSLSYAILTNQHEKATFLLKEGASIDEKVIINSKAEIRLLQ